MFLKEELDISETLELLKTAHKAAKIGIFQFEVETQHIYWDELLKSIFEVPKAFKPTAENILDFIPTDKQPEKIRKIYCKAIEQKKPFNLEHEINTYRGNPKNILLFGQPVFKNGAFHSFKGALMDITKRKKSELELIQKSQYLHLTEDIGKMGYWRWNFLKNEGTWSDNLYKIFEWNKHDELGFEIYQKFVHPNDIDLFNENINTAISNKKLTPFSHRFILKNGKIKTIFLAGQVLTNKRNEVVEIVGTCQDITENKVKEQELAYRKKQQNLIEKVNKTGSWQWNITKDIFICSENLRRVFEFDKHVKIDIELVRSRIHPDDKAFAKTIFQEIKSNKEPRKFSHRIVLKDGTQKILEVFAQAEINPAGEITHIIGSTQDVTDYTLTKETLKKKNQLLGFVEKTTKVGYWSWKPATDSIFWSDNLYQMFGLQKGEDLNRDSYFDCVHPDDKNYVKEKIEASLKNFKFDNFTHRVISKYGEVKTIQIVGEIISNPKSGYLELSGTCLDITESEIKTAEIRLKNHQLSIAENMAMIGSWHWNLKTDEIKWSDNLYNIYGHKKATPITFERYLNYIHKDDKERLTTIIKESFDTKKFIDSIYKVQLKNGVVKILKSTGKIITDENGDIIEMIGTCQDITKSRTNELELLHKNQSLSFAEEITKIGNWKWDFKTKEFECSKNMYKIAGIKIGTPITIERYLARVPKDEHKMWHSHVKNSFDNKHFKTLTHRLIQPDNTFKILEVNAKILKDQEGNVTGIFGTSQDVTERKQREYQLIEKNQQLNLMEELAMIGYWRFNLTTNKFDWSDNSYRMNGFEIGIPMDMETLFTNFTKEDQENMNYIVEKYSRTKIFEKFTYQVILRKGVIRTIEVVGQVITNENNEAIEFIGSSRDITEQVAFKHKILAVNKNLEETAAKLGARNKQLAEFNQISSHNLRAPVGNLNTLLSLYQKSKNEREKLEIFSKFGTVIEHLSLTLNTLVQSLKIKNNPNQIKEKLNFNDTLTKTKESLAGDILKTKAIFKSDFSAQESIHYNPIYLESIFLNLVGNAIKYRSPDRTPKIEISSHVTNNNISITIKDNGLGIDLKKHGHKLFGLNQVFHRHPDAKGSGLFLTKAHVEAMGGSIRAESEVNVGTTFLITLNNK